MAVPRNLIYVLLCTIIGAFIGMIYVVYTEKDLGSFLEVSHSPGKVVVHPLFQQLKNVIDEYKDIREEKVSNLNSTYFFSEYIKKNLPCLVVDGCKEWPALSKWQDKSYLADEFGPQSVLILFIIRNDTSKDFSYT